MNIDIAVRQMIPDGWSWCLYGPCGGYKARAVIVSPDHKRHIGREGSSATEALRIATRDARAGAKE